MPPEHYEVRIKSLRRIRKVQQRQNKVGWKSLLILMGCMLFWGCAGQNAQPIRVDRIQPSLAIPGPAPARSSEPVDYGWTQRSLTEDDIMLACEKDPDLTPNQCKEILARMNAKAPYYISEDIRSGRTLKVPNDFSAFAHWTPLPHAIPEIHDIPQLVLIDKENFFIGWYEKGTLRGDTQICIGKPGEDTQTGIYRVLEKDPDHYSRSYSNSYGRPAWMPWALRIYDTVWIHAGDITTPYCSHGCVTLPLEPSMELFRWTDTGTLVLVVDSLNDLQRDLRKHAAFMRSVKVSSQ